MSTARRTRRTPQRKATAHTAEAADVDVVVPVYNALEDVQQCLQALKRGRGALRQRVLVVNDGSEPPTTEWLRGFCGAEAGFTLLEHEANAGYTRAVNTGLRASTARFVVTLNSDAIVSAGWADGLARCMDSGPRIGIVGPLSNAATWQNVPQLYNAARQFAVNSLPEGVGVDEMAAMVARVSLRSYPRAPFLNGFCFMIRREVIHAIGVMDEENFPVGYGEENDFCIRAAAAGFELAIADDVYVFHAKSRSFGHERRKELSRQGSDTLKRKHGASNFEALVARVKDTTALDKVRARIRKALAAHQPAADLLAMKVLFLLPVKGAGGGVHSVVQEVAEMCRLGIAARVAVRAAHLPWYLERYADIACARELFLPFEGQGVLDVAADFDVVVGTIYTSMKFVKRVVDVHPHILPAYYVQDYEPLFEEPGTPGWQEARDSYTLLPHAMVFAKTEWLVRKLADEHGVAARKVEPSIDHDVYRPLAREPDGRVHIAAMIRPQTPRRGAARTMRVLSRLHQAHPGKLAFHLFGCPEDHEAFQPLQRDFPYENLGVLPRRGVADVLGRSDVFLDFSDYQAFGRTALEAMASGCTAVVPREGGSAEYARDGDNALVVDTLDEDACFAAVDRLVSSPGRLVAMRHAGLLAASRYSVHAAAVSECVALAQALAQHRASHPKQAKPGLALLTLRNIARRHDGVDRMGPYRAHDISRRWELRPSELHLPTPGSAAVAVMNGLPMRVPLPELNEWLGAWQTQGRLVQDLDDAFIDAIASPQGMPPGPVRKAELLAAAADVLLAPTEWAASIIRPLNPEVHVVPDGLDEDLWKLDAPRDHSKGPFARKPEAPVRIGWLAAEDDPQAELLAPLLGELQQRHGDKLQIEVIGAFQNRSPLFGQRVGFPREPGYGAWVNWLQLRVHWDLAIVPFDGNGRGERLARQRLLELAALDVPAFFLGQLPSHAPDAAGAPVHHGSAADFKRIVDRLVGTASFRRKFGQPYPQAYREAAGSMRVAAQLAQVLASLVPPA